MADKICSVVFEIENFRLIERKDASSKSFVWEEKYGKDSMNIEQWKLLGRSSELALFYKFTQMLGNGELTRKD